MKSGPMFFTSIDQIIEWASNIAFTSNELLAALRETKKEGYEIHKIDQVVESPEPKELTPDDFVRVPDNGLKCTGCHFDTDGSCYDNKLPIWVLNQGCDGYVYKLKSEI